MSHRTDQPGLHGCILLKSNVVEQNDFFLLNIKQLNNLIYPKTETNIYRIHVLTHTLRIFCQT